MRKLVIASETIDQNVDFDVRSSLERSEAAEIEAELRAGVKLGVFAQSASFLRETWNACAGRFADLEKSAIKLVMLPPIRQSVAATRENLYLPAGAPKGGVVCLHGSEGGWAGWNDVACALFAANGFAALSHNYTLNARWLVHPDIDNVPLESTQAALAAMRLELAPFGCGVGLYGVSRGAERALLLAQLLAEDGCAEAPDAIAVHSPPDEAWPAFLVADFVTGEPWAGDRQRSAWSWRGSHERTRPGTPLGGAALTRYPLFIAQGAEDKISDAEMARRLVERLTHAGRAPEAHFFDGEGHVFQASTRNREWALLIEFFERHLAVRVRDTKDH